MNEYVFTFYKRYSTALLSDAAYRANISFQLAPSSIVPLAKKTKLAGPVCTIKAQNDLVTILLALHRASEGEVMVISNRTEVGILGDLIATEARRKSLGGFLVDGFVRDSNELRQIGVPIFSRGTRAIGPLKLKEEEKGIGSIGEEIFLEKVKISPGDWVFCDRDSILVFSAKTLPLLFEFAKRLWEQEENLLQKIRKGSALGDLLAIEEFYQKRNENKDADFNAHLASLKQTI